MRLGIRLDKYGAVVLVQSDLVALQLIFSGTLPADGFLNLEDEGGFWLGAEAKPLVISAMTDFLNQKAERSLGFNPHFRGSFREDIHNRKRFWDILSERGFVGFLGFDGFFVKNPSNPRNPTNPRSDKSIAVPFVILPTFS